MASEHTTKTVSTAGDRRNSLPEFSWQDLTEPGAYVDLHRVPGRVERVDQKHVKYFLDLKPGEKQFVKYSVTYKRRKVGPELNIEKKREPL